MNIGHNIGLTALEVAQALREFALTKAKSRGVVVATIDHLDFQNRATVHYQTAMVQGPAGPDGATTQSPTVTGVMVVWED